MVSKVITTSEQQSKEIMYKMLEGTVTDIKKTKLNAYEVFVKTEFGIFKADESNLSVVVKVNDKVTGQVEGENLVIFSVDNNEKINGIGSSSKFLRDIINRIEYTGRTLSEPIEDSLFKNLVVSEDEFNKIDFYPGLIKFINSHEIDFVCIKCNGKINYTHYTESENAEDILSFGFTRDESYVPDLGYGVYAIEKDDEVGFDNLSTYFMDKKNTSMAIVNGTYEGNYLYCTYGNGHEHYIVLLDEVLPDTISIEHKDLEDIFGF